MSSEGTLLTLVTTITKSLLGDKKGKGRTRMMDNHRPTTEGVRLEGGCKIHFFGVKGGLLGVEILSLVGKQQIQGKIRVKTLGKTWGKTWGKIGGVTIKIIQ